MKPLRDAFGEELVNLGGQHPELVVVTADIAWSSRVEGFAAAYPERYFQVGVAEQNMMSMAAGLATTGKTVFATTLAVFATRRVLDQVAISIAYPRLNVKIFGTLTGLYAAKTCATHQAFEDVAIMRALPNMTIAEPGDERDVRLLGATHRRGYPAATGDNAFLTAHQEGCLGGPLWPPRSRSDRAFPGGQCSATTGTINPSTGYGGMNHGRGIGTRACRGIVQRSGTVQAFLR